MPENETLLRVAEYVVAQLRGTENPPDFNAVAVVLRFVADGSCTTHFCPVDRVPVALRPRDAVSVVCNLESGSTRVVAVPHAPRAA